MRGKAVPFPNSLALQAFRPHGLARRSGLEALPFATQLFDSAGRASMAAVYAMIAVFVIFGLLNLIEYRRLD